MVNNGTMLRSFVRLDTSETNTVLDLHAIVSRSNLSSHLAAYRRSLQALNFRQTLRTPVRSRGSVFDWVRFLFARFSIT
jgi:hypothetical protein